MTIECLPIPDFLHGKNCVYRVWSTDNTCLYVGNSSSLPTRMNAHARAGIWFGRAARVVVTLHPDKATAERVEFSEIGALRPRFNINGRKPRWAWTACDFAEAYEIYTSSPPKLSGIVRPERRAAGVRAEFLDRFPEIAEQVLAAFDITERVAA